jgi:hypothetical protein
VPRYCSAGHRQRAYEARNAERPHPIESDLLSLPPQLQTAIEQASREWRDQQAMIAKAALPDFSLLGGDAMKRAMGEATRALWRDQQVMIAKAALPDFSSALLGGDAMKRAMEEATRAWRDQQEILAGAVTGHAALQTLTQSSRSFARLSDQLRLLPTPLRLVAPLDSATITSLRARTSSLLETPLGDLDPKELAETETDWEEVGRHASDLVPDGEDRQLPAPLAILAAALIGEAASSGAVLWIIHTTADTAFALTHMAWDLASNPALAVPVSTVASLVYLSGAVLNRLGSGAPDEPTA